MRPIKKNIRQAGSVLFPRLMTSTVAGVYLLILLAFLSRRNAVFTLKHDDGGRHHVCLPVWIAWRCAPQAVLAAFAPLSVYFDAFASCAVVGDHFFFPFGGLPKYRPWRWPSILCQSMRHPRSRSSKIRLLGETVPQARMICRLVIPLGLARKRRSSFSSWVMACPPKFYWRRER